MMPLEQSRSGDNAYYMASCQETHYRPNYAVCLHKIEQRKNGRLPTEQSECSAAIGAKRCPALRLLAEEKAAGQAIYFISRAEIQAQTALREVAANEKFTRMMETGRTSSRRTNYASEDFSPMILPAIDRPYVPKAAPLSKVTPKRKEDDLFADSVGGSYAEAITRAASGGMATAKPTTVGSRPIVEIMPQSMVEKFKATPAVRVIPAEKSVVKEKAPIPAPVAARPGMSPLELARMMRSQKS